MHCEILQVWHRKATKLAVQTSPHITVLLYSCTFWEKSSGDRPPPTNHLQKYLVRTYYYILFFVLFSMKMKDSDEVYHKFGLQETKLKTVNLCEYYAPNIWILATNRFINKWPLHRPTFSSAKKPFIFFCILYRLRQLMSLRLQYKQCEFINVIREQTLFRSPVVVLALFVFIKTLVIRNYV